jgi:hypothetical protein
LRSRPLSRAHHALGATPTSDNISSAGPFEFTVATYERSKPATEAWKSFQLSTQTTLTEDRYNDLWWRINQNRIRRNPMKTITTFCWPPALLAAADTRRSWA